MALAATLLPPRPCPACGVFGSPDLVVYNAQHEELLDEIVPWFEEESGLDVELRSGKDLEMANQIVEEGEDSPADVFLTENSPAMSIVDNAGPLRRAARGGHWRRSPTQYVPDRPRVDRLPGPLHRRDVQHRHDDRGRHARLDPRLRRPGVEGPRRRSRPTGADFQAIVSAVLELEGEEATARRGWPGLKDNGVIVQNNLVVMQSVDSGEVDAGIAYHYYWYRDREENGTDSDNSALHFFGDQDPGAFLSISGAGILDSSEHQRRGRRSSSPG